MIAAPPCDVLHHPHDHPYVSALGVDRRSDFRHGVVASAWDADALHHRGVRIVHLHFGFEHLGVERLAGWVAQLRRHHIGLVHTVHDLDNPHLVDQADFHHQVEIVVGAADALLTLTPTIADEVARRFGRRPWVVAHPRVVTRDEVDRAAARATRPRAGIYIHAATCRPNLDLDLLHRIGPATREFGGLLIHARTAVCPTTLDRLDRIARRSGGRLTVDDRLTDDELWHRLSCAAAVILPYRWGTHSGLLEAAHDLGTPVLAPLVGGLADQGARVLDVGNPGRSIHEAIHEPGERPRQTDRQIGAVHRRVYADVRSRLP